MAALAVACVLSLTLWQVMSGRSDALRHGDRLAEALARVAEEHCLALLDAVDHFIREVSDHAQPDGTLPAGILDELLPPHLRQFPVLRTAFIAGPDGVVRQAGSKTLVGLDLSGRDFFQALASGSERNLSISLPDGGRGGIALVRPVLNHAGGFAGLVGVSVDPHVLEDQLGSLVQAGQGFSVVMRLDGLVLARVPDGDLWRGGLNAREPAVLAAANSPNGVLRAVGTIEGARGNLAYRRLADYPVLVVLGLRQSAVLTEWQGDALVHCAIGAALAVTVLLLGFWIDRSQVERLRIRRELEASEERYRLLIEHSPLGIVLADRAGRVIYANHRWEELAGEGVGDVSHRAWLDAIAEEDRPALGRAWAAMAEGGPFDAEVRLAHGTERGRWLRVHVAMTGGGTQARIVVAEDITQARDVARSLRLSEEKFSKAFRGSPDALVISTRDRGRYLEVNGAFCRLLGYSETEFLGTDTRGLRVWARPADRDMLLRLLEERGQVEDFQAALRRRDGSLITVLISAQTLEVDGRSCMLCICRDVSEREAMETRARDLVARLDASNKELEQFAYVASHDLQEPLRMIASYAQLLGRRYAGRLDSDADEFIGYLVDGAKRMQVMIRDLLEYSRVDRMGHAFIAFDANEALAEARRNLMAAIQDSGAVIEASPLPRLVADRSQFVRLLQNLLGNAIKYHHPDRPPRISISTERLVADWRFSIADNGIGIEAQYFERIFMIFQRLHTRAQFEGTGIGLAICQKIVQRHGGSVWVESVVGVGSVFHFTVPVVEDKNPSGE